MAVPAITQIICPSTSALAEFSAAIGGAVVGGAIAFAVQMYALREARTQRARQTAATNMALAHALLFKLIKINSHLRQFNLGVNGAIENARAAGFRGELWQIVFPVVNVPDSVSFATDEMVMLRQLKDDALFNEIAEMDERHNGTLSAIDAYARFRLDLTEAMPPDTVRGNVGSSDLTSDQMRVLRPKMVALEGMLQSIVAQSRLQETQSWDLLTRLNKLLGDKLGLVVRLERVPDNELVPTKVEQGRTQ